MPGCTETWQLKEHCTQGGYLRYLNTVFWFSLSISICERTSSAPGSPRLMMFPPRWIMRD